MFCQKCGKQMEEGVQFCSTCGHAIGGELPRSNVPKGAGERTVLKRANANKSTIIGGWFMVGCFIILAGVLLFMYMEETRPRYSDVKAMLGLFGLISFSFAVTQLLKVLSVSKSFVCVCEDCVYGIAGKAFFFTTEPFEVEFHQITNVRKGSAVAGNIVIECGPKIYGCLINQPGEIIELIKEKVNQA